VQPATGFNPRMRRLVTHAVLLLALCVGCAGRVSAPRVRTVESDLISAGFRTVVPDTPKKQQAMKRLQPRRLTEASRNGKPYYWYADPDGCGCIYVGGEAAYRRYDELAQARDNVASDTADRKMLRTVESAEETPPDAWFWQDALPEYFPE
jgi:hypothetical protein